MQQEMQTFGRRHGMPQGRCEGLNMLNWRKINNSVKAMKDSLSRLNEDEKEIVFEEIHKR